MRGTSDLEPHESDADEGERSAAAEPERTKRIDAKISILVFERKGPVATRVQNSRQSVGASMAPKLYGRACFTSKRRSGPISFHSICMA